MARIQFVLSDRGSQRTTHHSAVGVSAVSRPMGVVFGLLEASVGSIPEDSMLPFTFDPLTDRLVLGKPENIADQWAREDLSIDDITGGLTQRIWRTVVFPVNPTFIGGQVIARPCSAQVAGGQGAWLLCGIVTAEDGVRMPYDEMFGATGADDLRFMVTSKGAVPYPAKMGDAAMAIFLNPNWGWGEELIGFRSTLRPAVCAALDRIYELRRLPSRTQEQEAEILSISKANGTIDGGRGDKLFQKFQALHDRINEGYGLSASATMTRSQIDRERMVIKSIIGAILRHQDDDAPDDVIVQEVRESLGLEDAVTAPGL